jgi:hypothetical protein
MVSKIGHVKSHSNPHGAPRNAQGHTAHVQAVAAAKVGFFRWTVVVMKSMECMEFIDD